jgi:hypothetical protein
MAIIYYLLLFYSIGYYFKYFIIYYLLTIISMADGYLSITSGYYLVIFYLFIGLLTWLLAIFYYFSGYLLAMFMIITDDTIAIIYLLLACY